MPIISYHRTEKNIDITNGSRIINDSSLVNGDESLGGMIINDNSESGNTNVDEFTKEMKNISMTMAYCSAFD